MKTFIKVAAWIMLSVCGILALCGWFMSPNNVSTAYWLPTMMETGTLGIGIALIALGVAEKIEDKTKKVIEKVENEIKEEKNNNSNEVELSHNPTDYIIAVCAFIAFIGIVAAIVLC